MALPPRSLPFKGGYGSFSFIGVRHFYEPKAASRLVPVVRDGSFDVASLI
jgi:hypothetical protein